jgi:hypothetical protein
MWASAREIGAGRRAVAVRCGRVPAKEQSAAEHYAVILATVGRKDVEAYARGAIALFGRYLNRTHHLPPTDDENLRKTEIGATVIP